MNNQIIYSGNNSYNKINDILRETNAKKVLLVCDNSYDFMFIKEYMEQLDVQFVRFSEFRANPMYEEVISGIQMLHENECDMIVSIGGGSAIDVAKCIKLYSEMNDNELYFKQEYKDTKIKHLAIPSTAGTGSESTKFAVIYYNGEKQSIAHESIIPNYTVLEPKLLETLPIYQKKATMLDALCQGIESLWSVNATSESFEYAKSGIKLILENFESYIENEKTSLNHMSIAANLSGQAINITQTTAAHAMSYKITSKFGLAHGHAVAVCLPYVWSFLSDYDVKSIELQNALSELNHLFQCETDMDSIHKLKGIIDKLDMKFKYEVSDADINELVDSVNIVRLKNTPVNLTREDLYQIYNMALRNNDI